MAFSLFNFADTDEDTTPVVAWAKKIGRSLGPIFDGLTGTQPQPGARAKDTSTDFSTERDNTLNIIPNRWKVAQDRKAMYKDIENMDRNDELVSTALDIIADCATDWLTDTDARIRFKAQDPEVQAVLDALVHRLDLDDIVWQIARECAAHGTIFREIVLDRSDPNNPFVSIFKQTIPYHIWPKVNDKGDKQPGWIIKMDNDVYNGGGQELAEWQVVPFIHGAKRGYLSIPPLASARAGYQRLTKMEDGMAVARLIRAYDKFVHKIPVGKEWDQGQILGAIRLYKDAITKRKMETTDGQMNQLDNPLDVQTDFYVPDDGTNRGGVDVLSSTNTNLGNLNDVYYAREKLLARLKVPVEMLQLMSQQKTHVSKGGGGMSPAEVQFARTLRSLQAVIRRGISRLADIELMLRVPEKFVQGRSLYTIELAAIDTADPQEDAALLLTYGQACVYFLEAFGALPPELMASKFLNLTTDQQAMMQTFLDTDGQRVLEARVKALENEALAPLATKTKIGENTAPPKPGGGSGNNNKSRAKRSSEQKGGKSTQGMSARLAEMMVQSQGESTENTLNIEDLVTLFADLQQSINQDLVAAGIPAPDVTDLTRAVIRKNLKDIAFCGEVPLG